MIHFDCIGERFDATDEQLTLLSEAFAIAIPKTAHKTFTVDIEITDAKKILALNTEYRQLAEQTDVLSFPTVENPLSTSFEELNIGSIALDPHFKSELAVTITDLIFHGTLHLLGFDHEANRRTWNKHERDIIKAAHHLGLTLNGIPEHHE